MIIDENLKDIYPWQTQVWGHINTNIKRIPHALLLHGRAGIGKYDFARYFSQSLLCANKSEQGYACGVCSSCNWFKDESHPDFKLLSPEDAELEDEGVSTKKTKKKTQISVAQIRELQNFLGLTSHRSDGLRIVLIHPAEALNNASANALLKMLEEPAAGVIFVLVTHQLDRLLPTIISRCHKINMPIPTESQALLWLGEKGVKNAKQQLVYFNDSPIKAFTEQLQFSHLTEIWRLLALGDKLQAHVAAPILIGNSVETGIIAIQKWIYDIASMRMTRQIRYHVAHINALQVLAEKVNLKGLLQLQKKVDELRRTALHPLNHDLQMESLLIDYAKIFSSK
jgi:DNA polymerase-3 subunit delta'